MMFLLQVVSKVQAVSPPIHVIMDQPPSMPDWEKVLISASAGAIFGILGSITMEFVKPRIAKWLLRKTVTKQLGAELLDNLNHIEAGGRILAGVEGRVAAQQAGAINLVGVVAASCNTDRYDHYFAEEKSLVYEIDEEKLLSVIYQFIKQTIPHSVERRNYVDLKQYFHIVATLGKEYIAKHELTYMPVDNALEQAYLKTVYVPDPSQNA